jgi:hypothetical protein
LTQGEGDATFDAASAAAEELRAGEVEVVPLSTPPANNNHKRPRAK